MFQVGDSDRRSGSVTGEHTNGGHYGQYHAQSPPAVSQHQSPPDTRILVNTSPPLVMINSGPGSRETLHSSHKIRDTDQPQVSQSQPGTCLHIISTCLSKNEEDQ